MIRYYNVLSLTPSSMNIDSSCILNKSHIRGPLESFSKAGKSDKNAKTCLKINTDCENSYLMQVLPELFIKHTSLAGSQCRQSRLKKLLSATPKGGGNGKFQCKEKSRKRKVGGIGRRMLLKILIPRH